MRRECRERFPCHRGWAIPTCITARASRTCRDACRDRYLAVSFEIGGGGNVPGIPGACATCNFTYLVRGPLEEISHPCPNLRWTMSFTGSHFLPDTQPLMMTSSNGNIFRVTGPLCGEFTGPGEFPTQRPVTRSFVVFFDLRLNKRLSKQPRGWWFETPSCSLWRHRNVSRMCHFDEVFVFSSLHCHHFDNFRWSRRWKFRQNDDIFVWLLPVVKLFRIVVMTHICRFIGSVNQKNVNDGHISSFMISPESFFPNTRRRLLCNDTQYSYVTIYTRLQSSS